METRTKQVVITFPPLNKRVKSIEPSDIFVKDEQSNCYYSDSNIEKLALIWEKDHGSITCKNVEVKFLLNCPCNNLKTHWEIDLNAAVTTVNLVAYFEEKPIYERVISVNSIFIEARTAVVKLDDNKTGLIYTTMGFDNGDIKFTVMPHSWTVLSNERLHTSLKLKHEHILTTGYSITNVKEVKSLTETLVAVEEK